MVIRVPVNLDVTDNDIAESIEDEVDRGARRARSGSAGSIIGRALGIGIGSGIEDGIQDGISRGTGRLNLSAVIRGATAAAAQGGDEAGLQFGRGFSKGSSNGVKESISNFGELNFSLAKVGAGLSGLVTAIVPVGPALGGVAAGVVAIAGAAAQAAGAAVSLGGVLAAAGLGAGVSVLASRGLTDAFEAQAKAQEELSRTGLVSAATQADLKASMDALAPSAREIVTEVQALAPAWSAMQNAVQGRFFEGLAASMRSVSDAVLPTLTERFTQTAAVIGGALGRFAEFASSADFVERLNGVLGSLNSVLDALLPGVGQIADALFIIFQDGLVGAVDMAQAFTDLTTRFNDFIHAATDSGFLPAFFERANSVAGTLVDILGNLGSILLTVFGQGAPVGQVLLETVERLTGSLADFLHTAEALSGLEAFFGLVSQTGDTLASLGAVIGPIFAGLFDVIGVLIPHINTLRDALLPLAIVIGESLGTALTGLSPLLDLLVGLVVLLVQALAPLVSVLVSALGPALAEIGALFMDTLGPSIQSLIPLLAPVVAWFSAVFAAQIQNAVNLIVTVLGGVFKILGGLIDFLVGVFSGDWKRAWEGIKTIFSGVVDIIRGLVSFLWNTIINQFTGNSARLRSIVDQVNAFLKQSFLDGVNSVIGFFRNLPGQIGAAIGNLAGLLFGAGQNVIQGLIDGIRSMIGRVGSAMGSIAATIRSFLPFSPAKEGPLSGAGNPEASGRKIVDMLSSGIDSQVALPARAMSNVLAPLTPTSAQSVLPGTSGSQAVAGTSGSPAVEINQNFFGPTTSGGRLQELNWTARYATQARTETVGGVAT